MLSPRVTQAIFETKSNHLNEQHETVHGLAFSSSDARYLTKSCRGESNQPNINNYVSRWSLCTTRFNYLTSVNSFAQEISP